MKCQRLAANRPQLAGNRRPKTLSFGAAKDALSGGPGHMASGKSPRDALTPSAKFNGICNRQ